MTSRMISLATLAGSPQSSQTGNDCDVSQVEYEILLALLASAHRQQSLHRLHALHRPWNAPEATLEPVTGYDPRD